MTVPIAVTLIILGLAVVLFVTERLRIDLVALLVLGSLAIAGLVTPAEALSGFSNPAVVTVWAVFILSGGLSRTGVANLVGRQVMRLAGTSEARLLIVIMLTTGVMSAFMNNVGVAALLLPVVVDIARRTGRPPSKLLMPLAYGSLLGGLTTLIGTPPNILISDALRDNGLQPFSMFDYAPVGGAALLAGIFYMVLFGRHLLPERDTSQAFAMANHAIPGQVFDLKERLFVLRLRTDSGLVGKTLTESRLGAALGVNVLGIIRDGQAQLAPDPGVTFMRNDRLLVSGRSDRVQGLLGRQHLVLEERGLEVDDLTSNEIEMAEMTLSPRSSYQGQTVAQIDFRRRYGVNVLAIWRDGTPKRTNLQDVSLQLGDTLLVQGTAHQLDLLREIPEFLVSGAEVAEVYRLQERLMTLRVPEDSALVGHSLAESRLGDAYGLTVLAIVRDGNLQNMPGPSEPIEAGDMLLVEGKQEDMATLRGLQELELDREYVPDLTILESERVGLVEAVLSPYTTLAGQTLRQLHFREKYGLSVLAIWREGRAFRSNLRDMALRLGDALLLYGSREKLKVLGSEPDFLVLTQEAQETPRLNKAPLAGLVMAAVLIPVIVGWLPIAIAAVAGAALMVVLGCLTMEEAYRYIEWKAIFLIAGMLPLGIAMQQTGAASFLTEGLMAAVGGLGPLVVVVSFFLITTLASQVMPNPAVVVLLAPIALNTASELGISPHALMMTVALAASASFLSPVAHPANVLIMGPGGYQFKDYLKVGLPLTLVVLIVVLLILPFFWPL